MKALIFKSIFILFIATGYTTQKNIQVKFNEPTKVTATFEGYDEFGYNFTFINSEEEEEILTFEVISEELLSKYNLKEDTYIGGKFEIVYDYQTSEDDEETVTLVLQSIKKVE